MIDDITAVHVRNYIQARAFLNNPDFITDHVTGSPLGMVGLCTA